MLILIHLYHKYETISVNVLEDRPDIANKTTQSLSLWSFFVLFYYYVNC